MRWMLQDSLQSVRAITDGTNVLSAQAYSPYGEPLFTDLPTDFGFTGEQTDPTNDLVYLRVRYLNPRLGIFGSLDPLEGQNQVVGSLNRYNWVRGSVVNLRDSSGMTPIDGLPYFSKEGGGGAAAPCTCPENVAVNLLMEYRNLINDPVIDYGGIALAGLGLVGATAAALAFAPAALVLPIAAGIGAMGLNTIEQVEDMRWKWENRSATFNELLSKVNGAESAMSGIYGAGIAGLGLIAGGVTLLGAGANVVATAAYSAITKQPLDSYSLLSNGLWGSVSWGWSAATNTAIYFDKLDKFGKLLFGVPAHFSIGATVAATQAEVDKNIIGNTPTNPSLLSVGAGYANWSALASGLKGVGATTLFNTIYLLSGWASSE